MIHVALFSFQRTTLSCRNIYHVPYDIYYFIAARSVCQEIFKISFCLNSKHFPFRCLPVKASHLSYPRPRGDLYYITRFALPCQHPFQKKIKMKTSSCGINSLSHSSLQESFILERKWSSGFTSHVVGALGDIGFPIDNHSSRAI